MGIKTNRMRLVILGVDGTGKTTLAEALAKEFNAVVYKDHDYKEYFFGDSTHFGPATSVALQMSKAVPDNVNIIFDRFFMDEYVYGKVFHRKLDMELFKTFIIRALHQNFKIVYCYGNELKQDELIESHFTKELERAYQSFFGNYWNHPNDWIAVNPQLHSLKEIIHQIKVNLYDSE